VVAVLSMVVFILTPGKLIELSPAVRPSPGLLVHGLFNQYVGTIVHSRQRMSPSEINREKESIDREFGRGIFRRLIQRYDCRSGDYIIVNRNAPRVIGTIPKSKIWFILRKVVLTALRHPFGYLRHQACYLGHLTQFSSITYQDWGVLESVPRYEVRRAQLGVEFNSQLPFVRAASARLLNSLLRSPVFSLIFRHCIFLTLSAIFLGWGIAARRMELVIPSLFCLIYPLGYLMLSPADAWRYLLISYLGSWICVLAILNDIPGFVKKIRTQHRG